MSTVQQIVDALGPGWKLANPGAAPIEETIVAQVPSSDPAARSATETVNRGTGNYYVVVQDPEGHQRKLVMQGVVQGRAGTSTPLKQSGINDTVPDPTAPGGTKPNPAIYTGDLNNKFISWTQSGPLGDVPNEPKQPSKAEDLRKLDADGNDASKSGKPAVSLYDDKTGTHYPIPQGGAGAIQKIGDAYYVIKPDGSTKPAVDDNGKPLTETDKPTSTNVPGIGVVTIDPSKPIGQRVTVEMAEDKNAKASQFQPRVINGKTFVAVDQQGGGGIVWQEAKDENGQPLPTDQVWTAVSNDPRSSVIQLISSTGETKSIKKEDFHPPPSPQAGQAITPDTTSPFVVTIGDNGQPVFTDNKNQVSITDATRQFIDSLGVHLASGSMSEGQAQDLIKNITSQMTAQAAQQNARANMLQGATTAAGNILQGANQGAQTGAGVLQNRVTAASGMVQNLVGQAANAPHLMSAPSGLGENLVQGAQGWATELGGGQGVYDAAANMVKAADPNNSSGLAAQGYAALQQMLQKYQDLTGQMHPAAAVASGAAAPNPNGWPAPAVQQTNVTPNAAAVAANVPNAQGFNPQASTAALNAAGFQDSPEGRAAAIRAGRGDLLGMPPPSAVVPTPFAQSGLPEGRGVPFVSPSTVITTAPTVVG